MDDANDDLKITIQSLAVEMSQAFEKAVRPSSGEAFRKLKDVAPDWMRTVCRKAHDDGELLPDDHRYEFIEQAVDALANHDDTDSACESLEPDFYTSGLTGWLHSQNSRVCYISEAMEEYGTFKDGFKLLAAAQMLEREEVFRQVLDALQKELASGEARDDAAGEA
ncbi:hypothetical protein [Singulisphaera acidiphila]|uniref:Uncharacterized protein n=1 Tax=Singulisphaera acidiphila (strain ATCC BAA-1392 / DSM 18658 / VKM B-2454 / MOB10) TaxID=886293 RepID=L0DRU4_SINAD|nr:hypothetical protein [Singulisphaera acidiphila]AGA31715.1 hypothetical protein Sinac_7687 [Singulisphaera acidiphila DSM 18658]